MKNLPKVIERLPILLCIILIIVMFNKRDTKIESLQTQLLLSNVKIAEANKKIEELELQFETFKIITSSEFESTWKSLAIVRNNFIAIGKGFHLGKEDICPEGDCIEDF